MELRGTSEGHGAACNDRREQHQHDSPPGFKPLRLRRLSNIFSLIATNSSINGGPGDPAKGPAVPIRGRVFGPVPSGPALPLSGQIGERARRLHLPEDFLLGRNRPAVAALYYRYEARRAEIGGKWSRFNLRGEKLNSNNWFPDAASFAQ
jgi:hypothetical protein